MDQKTGPLTSFKIVDEVKGEVEAVFSTLNVIDKDGDVTRPGAFGEQKVRISAYNHQSWNGELPVGKGVIKETGTEAVMQGQFFMDVPKARDTFVTVKELGDQMEWSYGFDVLAKSEGKFPEGDSEGKDVRFLDSLKVHEVSPVILGAGVDTRTLSAKDGKEENSGKTLVDHITEVNKQLDEVVTRIAEALAMRMEKGETLADVTMEQVNIMLTHSKRLHEALAIEPRREEVPKELLEQLFRNSQALVFLTGGSSHEQ